METSAACASRLFPSFSDKTHLEFYHRRRSSSPCLSLRQRPLRALSSLGPYPLVEPASQQSSLMKELSDLKQQMKQKKKELKSQREEEKKKLKMQKKEEEEKKKAMKQKDCADGRKGKCDAESSSSSSESSDEECDSSSMRSLLEERTLPCISSNASVCHEEMVAATHGCEEGNGEASPDTMPGTNSLVPASAASHISIAANGVCCNDKTEFTPGKMATRIERAILTECSNGSSQNLQAPNRIEVCTGGKCKKAGSEQLLSALRMQIPNASNVAAMPCKCMGNCSSTMNVRVLKEDTNPQHHSHVRVEDANFILSHHYGLGRPPSGLPSLERHNRTRIPTTRSV